MRAKRISSDEQFRLITEWCQANDINPGIFYNWISRLRKRGMVIPSSAATTEPTAELQEVVKVGLIPSHEFMPWRPVPNDHPIHDPAVMPQKDPAVEILLGNSTIRFFHGADLDLIETTLRCLEGNSYAG